MTTAAIPAAPSTCANAALTTPATETKLETFKSMLLLYTPSQMAGLMIWL